jgi:phosphatidylserine/phosphatidylglycerophosphate/cardiolipin synthase-like enzyme
MTDAFVRAAKRGVDVQIITAGVVDTTLDRIVRKASQAHFGRVLEAGSANLDNRSFQLNNELNVAFLDKGVATRMTEIFRDDLKYTWQVTYEEWQRQL